MVIRRVWGYVSLACLCLGCSRLVVNIGGDSPPPQGDAGFFCHNDIDCGPWHGLCGADGGCESLPPDGGYNANQVSNTCQPGNQAQPCETFGSGGTPSYCTDVSGNNVCYCYPDPFFDQGGVCYRAVPECGACKSSTECGGTETDLNRGAGSVCLPVADAGDFCLFVWSGGCSRAFFQDTLDGGAQVCFPFCNTCPCIACNSEADCPDLATGRCSTSGACIPPCLTQSDCKMGEVCHVLSKYLDPSLGALYGAGTCGPPCTNTADCAAYEVDAGMSLSCVADRLYPDGGPSMDDGGADGGGANRCRVDGCMKFDECVPSPTDAGGNTWCDLWAGNQCVNSYCQIGVPAVGQCQVGFCCSADAGPAPQDDGGPAHGVCAPGTCGPTASPIAGDGG
jgi:hypothetical protein